MSNLRPYTKEWLEQLCAESFSFAEVLRKAGRKQAGGNQATLKKKIEEFNIDISHFTGSLWNKGKTRETDNRIPIREKYSIEEIFVENSPVVHKVLRGYVQRHKIIQYKCQKCGCDGSWQDGIITLELDHINGNNKDNRIENLRYLCPNCHALTETYRGKNKSSDSQIQPLVISQEDYVQALRNNPNIRQALIELGLAPYGANYDRARKLLEKYNIQK